MNQPSITPYDLPSRAFHWLTAIVVTIAFILGPEHFGQMMHRGIDPASQSDIVWHESLGLLVLLLTLLRLLWVALRPAAPQIPMSISMHRMALLMRVALWTLLLALPITALLALGRDAHPLTLLGGVRTPLYSPVTTSALPQAISEAAQGRFEALLALGSGLGARGANRMAEGMHFSVVCAEDMAHLNATADRPGRDFGNEFSQLYVDACSLWPRGSVESAFYSIPVSKSPVLVLSGGIDPVTPPRHGARVAQALGPMARHVVVPNAGHVVMGLGCMHDVLFRFIDAAENTDAMKVDANCAVKIPRPPAFVPVSRAGQGAP